jgi:butyrate kinase
MYAVFVINPGSTSTKVALFQDDRETFTETLYHSPEETLPAIPDQFEYRYRAVKNFIEKNDIDIHSIDAFVARGGLVRPLPGGTYIVDDRLLSDLEQGISGEHASNLGGILANALAEMTGKPAYIVDPVVVDELDDLARFSGHPDLPRKSIFHALNQKAVARKAAARLQKPYESCDLIVAHLGGGISVASHHRGRVIDVNNALDGDGPFSPERSGSLPAGDLVRLCFSGDADRHTVMRMIKGGGGMVAYLGSNDMRRIQRRVDDGDLYVEKAYRAMAYQIAKEIAAHGAVLRGNIDAIAITGGIAHDERFVGWIDERCSFLAPIFVFPGEKEMEALADGALRVLKKIEKPKIYSEIEVI